MKKRAPGFVIRKGGQPETHLPSKYYEELAQIRILTREEEFELAKKSTTGDLSARQKLVYHNLRYVVRVAITFRGYLKCHRLELADLFHEGIKGLIRSATSYKANMRTKFISYANRGVSQTMFDFINDRLQRVPTPRSWNAKLRQYRDIRDFLWEQEGTKPLVEEIASRMNCTLTEAIHLDWIIQAKKTPPSLEEIATDNQFDLVDDADTFEPSWSNKRYAQLHHRLRNILDDTSLELLVRRHNLTDSDDGPDSYVAISKDLGMTPKGVRRRHQQILDNLAKDPVMRSIWGKKPLPGPQDNLPPIDIKGLLAKKNVVPNELISLCCKLLPELQVTPNMLRLQKGVRSKEIIFMGRLAIYILTESGVPSQQIRLLIKTHRPQELEEANLYMRRRLMTDETLHQRLADLLYGL